MLNQEHVIYLLERAIRKDPSTHPRHLAEVAWEVFEALELIDWSKVDPTIPFGQLTDFIIHRKEKDFDKHRKEKDFDKTSSPRRSLNALGP